MREPHEHATARALDRERVGCDVHRVGGIRVQKPLVTSRHRVLLKIVGQEEPRRCLRPLDHRDRALGAEQGGAALVAPAPVRPRKRLVRVVEWAVRLVGRIEIGVHVVAERGEQRAREAGVGPDGRPGIVLSGIVDENHIPGVRILGFAAIEPHRGHRTLTSDGIRAARVADWGMIGARHGAHACGSRWRDRTTLSHQSLRCCRILASREESGGCQVRAAVRTWSRLGGGRQCPMT